MSLTHRRKSTRPYSAESEEKFFPEKQFRFPECRDSPKGPLTRAHARRRSVMPIVPLVPISNRTKRRVSMFPVTNSKAVLPRVTKSARKPKKGIRNQPLLNLKQVEVVLEDFLFDSKLSSLSASDIRTETPKTQRPKNPSHLKLNQKRQMNSKIKEPIPSSPYILVESNTEDGSPLEVLEPMKDEDEKKHVAKTPLTPTTKRRVNNNITIEETSADNIDEASATSGHDAVESSHDPPELMTGHLGSLCSVM